LYSEQNLLFNQENVALVNPLKGWLKAKQIILHFLSLWQNPEIRVMKTLETATFANGCFWCADAVFRKIEGIENVRSGFTGGTIKNPAYREVVRGLTKHVEAVQLQFDPQKISYREIVLIFFTTHDPTSLNRQGYDAGAHYRSVIFYHSGEQKTIAEKLTAELNKDVFDGKIVTEIEPASPFYEAKEMHQDFYNNHREVPYCKIIIDPKINKLRRFFKDKMKTA